MKFRRGGLRMFKVGKRASPGLEAIAEDGNQIPMFDRFNGSRKVTEAVNVGVPLTPHGMVVGGFSDAVSFEITARRGDKFSLATMLICTNDGFTGLSRAKLPKKGSKVYWLQGYDAGTIEPRFPESVQAVGCGKVLPATVKRSQGRQHLGSVFHAVRSFKVKNNLDEDAAELEDVAALNAGFVVGNQRATVEVRTVDAT